MSKVLKTAAVVVAVAALAIATYGASLGPTLAATTTVAGVSVATAATVAGIAASVLSFAAALTAKKPSLNGTGGQTQWKADPDAGIPYLMGRTGTGGNIIMRAAADGWSGKTNNDLSDSVTILSGAGPINAVESFAADKNPITFDSAGNAVPSGYRDYMFQKWQLGVAGAAALAVAAGTSAAPTGWDSAHKLSGYAAAMLRLRFDSDGKHYQNGTPPPLWVVQGVKLYDPRLDSTYPGGSGSCRALDETTYVYSENPYLHGLTWCLGRYQNGQRILGVGAPIAAIDVAAFVEGANIADINGWKVGGTVLSTDNKWDALKAMLQAGSGEPIFLGAKLSCRVDTPRVSLATVTIDDVWGDVSVQATIGQKDRINGIVPTWRDEASNWTMVPAAPIRVADYVTFDRYQRTKPVTYSLVQNLTQASQLARYEIENAREFPMTLPLKLRWMGYKPGDCVTVTLPEDGLNGQDVLLMGRSLDPATGTVTMTARTETFAKHAFALGQTGTAPATPTVTGPPLTPTPDSADWSITGTSLGGGGNVVPALIVAGAAVGTADDVIVEYRLYTGTQTVDQDWQAQGIDLPAVKTKVITDVKGGSPYQVSIRYRRRGVAGTRLILGPVTTALPTLADATAALAAIGVITSDSVLDRSEKPEIVQDYGVLVAEQSGIDAQATAFSISTEKTAYDSAVTALTVYLGTMSPAWNDYTSDTAIVRSVFIGKFSDVYAARQTLLNKIAAVAKARGDQGVSDAATAQATASTAASTASAAQASANSALTEITAIVSDSVLDKSEKPQVLTDWTAIYTEQSGIDGQAASFGITTEKTAYDTAVTALASYLSSLSPAWYDSTTDTSITRSTFITKFTDVYAARQTLLNKIAAVAKARADQGVSDAATAQATASTAASTASAAQTSANSALTEITAIVSDSVLDKSEKPAIVKDWLVLSNERSGIDAQATAFAITTEKTAYDTANAALDAYLSSLSPSWSDTTTDTSITRSTFTAKFTDVYYNRQALLNKIADVAKFRADQGVSDAATAQAAANAAASAASGAQTSANSALTQIGNIVADSILDKSEKPEVIKDWNAIYYEQSGIDAQATAFSITTEKTAYDTAVGALATYLSGLSPAWYDASTDTAITRTTFIAKFTDVYSARQALLNRIAAVAGTLASWGGVSGSGKPVDYADVTGANTAANTYNVGSISAGSVSGTINSGGGVANNQVTTPAIVNNAVTTPSYAYTPSGLNTSGSFANAQSVSFTATGAPVEIKASFILDCGLTSGIGTITGLPTMDFQIVRDSTVIYGPVTIPFIYSNTYNPSTGDINYQVNNPLLQTFDFADTPSAGAHTYYLQVKDGSQVYARFLSTVELKK